MADFLVLYNTEVLKHNILMEIMGRWSDPIHRTPGCQLSINAGVCIHRWRTASPDEISTELWFRHQQGLCALSLWQSKNGQCHHHVCLRKELPLEKDCRVLSPKSGGALVYDSTNGAAHTCTNTGAQERYQTQSKGRVSMNGRGGGTCCTPVPVG